VNDTMIDKLDNIFGLSKEARLKFGDGTYEVLSPGQFVRCAVTREPIPLVKLRYWHAGRQEAYASARIAMQRHIELRG
jgi:hypothetical protein